MMNVCPFCDHKNPTTAKSCTECGAELSYEEPEVNEDIASDEATETGISDGLKNQILEEMKKGRKIAAIKIHREATGMGLKESKEFVEYLARSSGIAVSQSGGCAGTVLVFIVGTLGLIALLSMIA